MKTKFENLNTRLKLLIKFLKIKASCILQNSQKYVWPHHRWRRARAPGYPFQPLTQVPSLRSASNSWEPCTGFLFGPQGTSFSRALFYFRSSSPHVTMSYCHTKSGYFSDKIYLSIRSLFVWIVSILVWFWCMLTDHGFGL